MVEELKAVALADCRGKNIDPQKMFPYSSKALVLVNHSFPICLGKHMNITTLLTEHIFKLSFEKT